MTSGAKVTEKASGDKPRLVFRRRLLALLVAVLVIGAPAVVLRVLCAGHACDEEADASSEVPFCSLPEEVREPLTNGFREGRSPDVLAVGGETPVVGGSPKASDPTFVWPSTSARGRERVPIAFSGPGVASEEIPSGTGLDDIAPTLADAIELRRRFPEVRSGTSVPGVNAEQPPALLVVVALKGIGTEDVEEGNLPALERMIDEGAGTMTGSTRALPIDPAAALATIGTGGLPSQHGIVGELIRNDEGELVEAWGERSPVSVIAALGDDLDESMDQRPVIGVAGSDVSDRGLIGGNWYVDVDRDLVALSGDPADTAVRMLQRGFGRDEVPDLLAVALEGNIRKIDAALTDVVEAADRAADGRYMIAVAGTGSPAASRDATPADRVAAMVDRDIPGPRIVEAAGASGLFLDQEALVETGLTEEAAIDALEELRVRNEPVVVDSFPAIAVSFSQYC